MKTIAMTTGELDFDTMFRFDNSGLSDAPEIAHAPVSVLLWIIFVVVMTILLTNMLVNISFIKNFMPYVC